MESKTLKRSKVFQWLTCNLFVEVVLEPQMDILAHKQQVLLLKIPLKINRVMGF